MLPPFDDYIGISEERLHHVLGVARKCYDLARISGNDEGFCRKMFLLGWLHDIGYEFSTQREGHSKLSAEIVALLLPGDEVSLDAIRSHGTCPEEPISLEKTLLVSADMTTGPNGEDISVHERLLGIKERFGAESEEYLTACNICYALGLTAINFADPENK